MSAIQYDRRAIAQFPEVDRRRNLSVSEFRKEYLLPGRPVVITDVMEQWKARSSWTLDYFKSRYGRSMVTVFRLGAERYNAEGAHSMELASFIDAVKVSSFDKYPCYVRDDWRLFIEHKELLSDYAVPKYFFDWFVFLPSFMRLIYPRIFIGPKGAVTPLHLDIWGTHAWLGQLVGRKRWILYSPDQQKLLYECAVEPHEPNYQKYPLFKNARPVECTIGPGDLIFVPGGWAHEVVSLDATISITHNYMGPGCFGSGISGAVKQQIFGRFKSQKTR